MSEKENESKFTIYTKLNEIYPSEKIEDTYLPIFEDLRNQFYKIYNNTDPSFIIRIPYTITLFGDYITKIFPDKIVANTTNDIIILFNSTNNTDLNIKFFDNIREFKFSFSSFEPTVNNNNNNEKKNLTIEDYIITGYKNGLKNVKTKSNNGANMLILLNNPNIEDDIDLNISLYLGMFISALYNNDKESFKKNIINKNTIYEMCILSLNELNSIDMSYYSSYIYFKLFLKKNNVGFNYENSFYQKNINTIDNKPLFQYIFDSFSPQPIKYYSSSKYWNKRKCEFRLCLALILKRYKKDKFNEEDIKKYSSDFKLFLNVFENNIESILQSLNIYVKKEIYTLQELKSDLEGINIDNLLKDINNYQGALITKQFELYNRANFIFNEYKEVTLLYHQCKINDKIDWIERIKESSLIMKNDYNCFSEEMNIIINDNINNNNKFKKIAVRLISEGWCGKMCAIGNKEDIEMIEKILNEKFEKYNENKGDNLISAWISDDLGKYCYSGEFSQGICLFNPEYEDFMLDYVKEKR